MPFNHLTEQTANEIMTEFKRLFSGIEIELVWFKYYSDTKDQRQISIQFKILYLKEDSMGYHELTSHGRLLNEIISTNALDIVPTSSTEEYLGTMTQNNQTRWNTGLPLNFTINRGNRIKEFPLSFDFLIRGYDPELSEYFQNKNFAVDVANKALIPVRISDPVSSGLQLVEASDWHFNVLNSIEELAMSNYGFFYNTCISQQLIRSSDEFITIPKSKQEEFLVQVKKRERYLEKFGKYYAEKLNNLFSAAIKENVSAIIPYNQKNAITVIDSLFMQINNFVEYALMVFLESEQLIQPIEYPNTRYKIWCITEIEHDAMDALNQEEFIQEYQAILAECDVLKKVIDFPFIYDGRGFLLLLSEEKNISADDVSLLKYITDGGSSLEDETVQTNIYKQFINNDKSMVYPFRFKFPIPERIQWINKTAAYRENIRIQLNKLEINHQADGQDRVERFNFDPCLRTTIHDDSPLSLLLNEWVKQDLIIMETQSNQQKKFFANNRFSVQIIECKNVNKLTSAIDELINNGTQHSKLKKKVTSKQLLKLKPFLGSTFKPAEPNTKRTRNTKSSKAALKNLLK